MEEGGGKFPLLLPKGSISVVLFKYTENKVSLKKKKFYFFGLQMPLFSFCILHKASNLPEAGVHSTLCTLVNAKAQDCTPGLV